MMLGSPVLDPLAVSAPVLRTVRSVAWLGDLGVPRPVLEELPRRAIAALGVPRPSRRRRWRAHRGRRRPLAQRRDRRLARVPRPSRASRSRSSSSHCGMAVHPDVYRDARAACSTTARRAHGVDEPARLVVPARRERRHADAHRRRQHLRGPAAVVRRAARDGRGQARARARATARRCASCRSRSSAPMWVDDPALRPRLPPAPHRDPGAGHRGAAAARWPRACSRSTSTAPSRCGRSGWSRVSSDGRWALLSKVHHCMVDGVAATDLMSVMFSDDADAARRRRRWSPAPGALDVELLVRDARAPGEPRRGSASARDRAAHARRRCARSARSLRAIAAAAPTLRPSTSSLTGPIGPHRRWSWAQRPAHRRQERPRRPRRHRQRRRPDAHHQRLPRAAAERAARRSRRPRRAHDGAGVGPPPGRARRLQQPRLGGVRAAAGGDRRPGRAPAR